MWISEQIDECTHTLNKTGFNIVEVISDNHSTNVSAFNILIKKYPHTRKDISIINHPSNINNGIYLFFDSVHLLKNIRNNHMEITYLIQEDLFSLNLISMNFMIG